MRKLGKIAICVVSEYRHGAARVMMELPGGVVEAGEDPLVAAQRELSDHGYGSIQLARLELSSILVF
jgi:predicted NUDIX family NTP pyrophosphohydrolase